MIVELVLFKNREGLSREAEYDSARHAAQIWLGNPDLIAKHFVRDGEYGGAVYIWPSKEAAQRAHNEEWRQGVIARTGGHAPEIRYFELMMTSDPKAGRVVEYGAREAAE